MTLNYIWWWGSSSRNLRCVRILLRCHYSMFILNLYSWSYLRCVPNVTIGQSGQFMCVSHLLHRNPFACIVQLWTAVLLVRCPRLLLLPFLHRTKVGIPVRVPFKGKIDLFQNYSYLIGQGTKKNPFEKQLHKKFKCECNSLASTCKITQEDLIRS